MKKIYLLILFLITSCSSAENKYNIDFSNNMTLKEFKLKLDTYVNNSNYPDIDD